VAVRLICNTRAGYASPENERASLEPVTGARSCAGTAADDGRCRSPRSVAELPEVACLHGLAADAERPCRRPAAVAADDLASDPASAWRAEKGHERRRVFGTAKATERHLCLDPLA